MTSSFQPVQYQKYARPEGFDPIQTPNIAPNIAREAANVSRDMRTQNLSEQRNYKTQALNQQIQQDGLDKLSQFSATLTQTLIQNQQRLNKEAEAEGLRKLYMEGVPPEIRDAFNQSRDELNANGLNMSRLANDAVAAGKLPWAVAREMEGMSPHMQVGYATGLLKQLGRQYSLDANQELVQGTVGMTQAEKMEALDNYRANWMDRTGLAQFNPAMLDSDLFPEMRKIDNQITAQWIRESVVQEKENLLQTGDSFLKDTGYTQMSFEQAQEYYIGAGLSRAQARKRIFGSVDTREELEALGRLTSFDGKTPVSVKFDREYKEAENRIVQKAIEDDKQIKAANSLAASQYAQQFIDQWETKQPTRNQVAEVMRQSTKEYGTSDPRLTKYLDLSAEKEAEEFWTDYLRRRVAAGDFDPFLLEDENIPLKVRQNPEFVNAGKQGVKGGKDQFTDQLEKDIMSASKESILDIPGYVPNAEIAKAEAKRMYFQRRKINLLEMNPADASEAAYEYVKGMIDLGRGVGTKEGKEGIGPFAVDSVKGYTNIIPNQTERDKAAFEALQRQKIIDVTIADGINNGQSVKQIVESKVLIPEAILEDAQKNSGSPQYQLPYIAKYISSKTGFRLSPWEIMRIQSQVVLGKDLKVPSVITESTAFPEWFNRLRYQFPTSLRSTRASIIQSGTQVPGQPYQVGDLVGYDTPEQQQQSFNPGLIPNNYGVTIEKAATENGIPPAVLAGLLDQESGFKTTAVSSAGAEGIAQFMPDTAREFGVDTSDPISSIDGAARYLGYLMDTFNGNLELALYAYNGGMGNVQQYGGPIPGNTENQEYVSRVMNKAAKYGYKTPLPPGLNPAVRRQLEKR